MSRTYFIADNLENLADLVETCRIALEKEDISFSECMSISKTLFFFVQPQLKSIEKELRSL